MRRFELPMVGGTTSVEHALAETIDAGTSGLLVRTGSNLRLVPFDALVHAARGRKRLVEVVGEPVIDAKLGARAITDIGDIELGAFIGKTKHKFGLIGLGAGKAHLFSIHENLADPYTTSSGGVRCERPNKPANTPPREFYHYYPPTPRDKDPLKYHVCRICDAYVP